MPQRTSARGATGYLLGVVVLIALLALALLVILLVGGVALAVYGGYVALLASRGGSSAPRQTLGLKPSYGLASACIVGGVLMFVGGVAMVARSAPPAVTSAPLSSTYAPVPAATTPPSLLTSAPAVAPPALRAPEAIPPAPPAPIPRAAVPAEPRGGPAYYKNCDAARAAGAAPLYAGEPGYRAGLDRDSDGVACER